MDCETPLGNTTLNVLPAYLPRRTVSSNGLLADMMPDWFVGNSHPTVR